MPKRKEGRTRANGEGRIRITSGGRYAAEIMVGYKYVGGKRKPDVRYGTFDKRPDALQFISDAKAGMVKTSQSKTLMSALADAWYDDLRQRVEQKKLEESTYAGYLYTKNHIRYQWHDYAVRDMTPDAIESGIDNMHSITIEWEDKKKKTGAYKVVESEDRISFGYRKKVKAMLGQMFKYAERKGMIEQGKSPMSLVEDLRNVDREKSEKEAFTVDEMTSILRAEPLFAGKEKKYRYYCCLVVGQAGGFRSQEVRPLLDTDIEPDGSLVRIDKAMKIGEKGRSYKGNTKTIGSEGTVELPAYVWKYAKWLRDHATECRAKSSEFYGKRLVLLSEQTLKAPVGAGAYRDNIKAVIAEIPNIKHLNPHEAQRHTYDSVGLYAAGIEKEVMMELSRHDSEDAFDGYTHMDDGTRNSAVGKFNAVIEAALSAPEKTRTQTRTRP